MGFGCQPMIRAGHRVEVGRGWVSRKGNKMSMGANGRLGQAPRGMDLCVVHSGGRASRPWVLWLVGAALTASLSACGGDDGADPPAGTGTMATTGGPQPPTPDGPTPGGPSSAGNGENGGASSGAPSASGGNTPTTPGGPVGGAPMGEPPIGGDPSPNTDGPQTADPPGMEGDGAPMMGDGDPSMTEDGDPPEMTDGPVGDNGIPNEADYAKYHDPGTGPWEMGSNEDCKMDTGMIARGNNLAVFRYGKLCHVQGGNTSGMNFSVTKTLGGVLAGRAAYLVKDVPRTGPGTGPILHEDKATDWLGRVSYNNEAQLSHVMAMVAHNSNLTYGRKRFAYDTVGGVQITSIVNVAMAAVEQLDGVPTSSSAFMRQEVFEKLGMQNSRWAGGTIGTGWTGTLEDMGRVGVMLAHDGWYGGEFFMEPRWVYRMSHCTHEDSNTAYGQLAWLNQRGGGTSFGSEIDSCAPAAFWPEYPHVGSEATDCGARDGNCKQEFDVGVFSAQGLGGQFIAVHPGLDLVIVAHNAQGPKDLWEDVRPAVVARDPKFMGDESAFCDAYGSGSYAPDLLVPRIAPTE